MNDLDLISRSALLEHQIEADRMGAMLVVGKGHILSAPAIVQTREESDLKLRVAQLERANENQDKAIRALRIRLDAAVEDLEAAHDCGTCIHADTCDPELCDCEDGDQYTWRGPQEEKEDRPDE